MTYEVLSFIVIVNAAVTLGLWRALSRKVNRPPGLKKKFAKQLWRSAPIEPKHERPKVIGDDYPSLASDADRRFFADFVDFADVVNWWLVEEFVQSRWRLQELPSTELKLNRFSTGPDFGRRYALFYNQTPLGELEISPSFDYTTEAPQVRAELEIRWVRLLGSDAITDLLDNIAMHVTDPKPNSPEYAAARRTIHFALTKPLWDTYRISEFSKDFDNQDWGEIELQLNGSAEWYIERARGWRRAISENNAKTAGQRAARVR